MKSKISLYNTGVGKNLLKRFWPLWTAYFLVLLAMLPMAISGTSYEQWYNPRDINGTILNAGVNMVRVSFVACMIAVMAMFGYLYNSRSCCMMNSLPVRRETMFLTACITGLVPMLLLDVLCFGITALMFAGNEYIEMSSLGAWLAAAVMSNTAFFGMAAFCATLTGSSVVLPMVYVVLNLAAFVAEGAVMSLLGEFLYGFVFSSYMLTPLSPVIKLDGALQVSRPYELGDGALTAAEGTFRIAGMEWLAVYCAAGIVLLAAALMIYRRRRMETAGDTVAVNVLKPIFRYCMTLGTAVVFACFMCRETFASLKGLQEGLFATAMLVAGGFFGYIIAEMILRKTLKVFPLRWKGFVICAGILAAAGLLCEFDVLGYETRVPEADEVESIRCMLSTDDIKEPQNVEDYIALHRHIIAGKERNEALTGERMSLLVHYQLKDGSRLVRMYEVDASREAASDEDSDLLRWQAIMNSDEVRGYRTSFDIPVSKETIGGCSVSSYRKDGDGRYQNKDVMLTTEQALELYVDCILPDIEDGQLGEYIATSYDEYYDTKTNTSITIETVDRSWTEKSGGSKYSSISFTVQVNSERCLRWLEENTGIVPVPLREADPPENGETTPAPTVRSMTAAN